MAKPIRANISISKTLSAIFCLLYLFCAIHNCYADNENYYDQHEKGWHWYDDPDKTNKDLQKNLFQNKDPSDPIQAMNAVQLTIKRSLDKAILNPTVENIKNYISLQNQLTTQSSTFANKWGMVYLKNPSMDYSVKHPSNEVGSQVSNDELRASQETAIRALAQHSGLFFFYRSNCPFCKRFAPIVKDFSDRYGITVIPITTDGVALPSFPQSYKDNGQAEKFQVTEEPALFSVDPYTHKAVPISYGLLTEDELSQRILDVATHFKGES